MRKNILLINPYIEDFSAYDHFSKPLGLIWLASYLRKHFGIYFVNALNRLHPLQKVKKFKPDGTGDFVKRKIPPPDVLADIPRDFKRYGIDENLFIEELKKCEKPDFVFITSGMTYWYTGLNYTIEVVKSVFSEAKIILGGIYTAILPLHAKKNIKADFFIPSQNIQIVLDKLEDILEVKFDRGYLPPSYDILGEYYYIPLLTSMGCVFNCSYCIGHRLTPFMQFNPLDLAILVKELKEEYDCKNFAFYDDALLFNSEKHVNVFLEKIIDLNLNVSFYTPNGLHIKFLTQKTARLMKQAGFKDIRLSLESVDEDFQRASGEKVTEKDFKRAVQILYESGFKRENIKVYIMLNIPEQKSEMVEKSMNEVLRNGAIPMLSFYSPIPGTPDFERARRITDIDEPLFQNNIVYLYRSGFNIEYFQYLKSLEKKYQEN